jgi:hypothetical protein
MKNLDLKGKKKKERDRVGVDQRGEKEEDEDETFFFLSVIRDYRPAVLETPSSFVLVDSFRSTKLSSSSTLHQKSYYLYTVYIRIQ